MPEGKGGTQTLAFRALLAGKMPPWSPGTQAETVLLRSAWKRRAPTNWPPNPSSPGHPCPRGAAPSPGAGLSGQLRLPFR